MKIYACAYNPNGIYKQTDGIGDFISLGVSQSINWMGITEAYNGDVYACAYNNGQIYKQTNEIGDFISLNQTLRNWHSMASHQNGDIYCGTEEGGIYKQTNGIGDFVLIAQLPTCHGICVSLNNDIYVCSYSSGIYKQTNCTGNFVLIWSTVKNFRGISANLNNDIYTSVMAGDIYKLTNGESNFIALNQTVRNWNGITSSQNNDVYANDYGGDIYKQTNGIGNFIALGQSNRYWRGMSATPLEIIPQIPHEKKIILNIPTIGFKHESIQYTPENLTATDYNYLINSDIKISPNIENYLQKINTGDFSKFPSISGKRLCAVNFSIDLYTMSDTTVAPSYFDILRSCGWKQLSISQTNGIGNFIALNQTTRSWYDMCAAPNGNIYACVYGGDIYLSEIITINGLAIFPDSLYNSVPSTIEVSFPEEGIEPRQIVYKISGAMGYVKFLGETGKPIKAEFSFIGALDKIYTREFEDMIVPENFDSAIPIALLGATFQLFGNDVSLQSFEINSGEMINLFSNIMRVHGYDGTRISDRNTIGNIVLNSDAEIPFDLYEKIKNNIQGDFLLSVGNLSLISSNVKVNAIEDELMKFNIEFPSGIILYQIDS